MCPRRTARGRKPGTSQRMIVLSGAARGEDAAGRVEGQAGHRVAVADRLGLVVGRREHPGHDLARGRAHQAGDAEDGDVPAPGFDPVSRDGQERLALRIGLRRDGHRVDGPRGPRQIIGRIDRASRGSSLEIPDLHHLVLAAGEQGEVVLPDEAAHPRMVSAGLDHEDRHPEVPHLVLGPGRSRPEDGDQQPQSGPTRPPLESSAQPRSSSIHVSRLRWRGRKPIVPPKIGGVRLWLVFSGTPTRL